MPHKNPHVCPCKQMPAKKMPMKPSAATRPSQALSPAPHLCDPTSLCCRPCATARNQVTASRLHHRLRTQTSSVPSQ